MSKFLIMLFLIFPSGVYHQSNFSSLKGQVKTSNTKSDVATNENELLDSEIVQTIKDYYEIKYGKGLLLNEDIYGIFLEESIEDSILSLNIMALLTILPGGVF